MRVTRLRHREQGSSHQHMMPETRVKGRETVVWAHGYVYLRTPMDNAGTWLIHCIITKHLDEGMSMVLQIGGPGLDMCNQDWCNGPKQQNNKECKPKEKSSQDKRATTLINPNTAVSLQHNESAKLGDIRQCFACLIDNAPQCITPCIPFPFNIPCKDCIFGAATQCRGPCGKQ